MARRLRRELFKVGGAAAPTPTQPAPSHPSSVASRPSPDQRTLVMIQLGDGDLRHTVDFRSVYATVLESWFGAPSQAILGGTYEQIRFLG